MMDDQPYEGMKSSRDFHSSHEPSHQLPPASPLIAPHTNTRQDPSHEIPRTSPLLSSSRLLSTEHQQSSASQKNQLHKESLARMKTIRNENFPILTNNSFVNIFMPPFVIGVVGILLAAVIREAISSSTRSSHLYTLLGLFLIGCAAAYPVFSAHARTARERSTHYVLMVCGSGGHTAEMIQMVERSIRPEQLSHRRWAVGKEDDKSYDKIMAFESRLFERFSSHSLDSGTFDIVRFGRARYVHQSWLTTPFTAFLSLVDILHILTTPPSQLQVQCRTYPGVIVTNGPGTGFLFLLIARLLKLIRIVPASHMQAIYVESWARVRSLSLTGKLVQLLKVADIFIVQSPFLTGAGKVLAKNLLVMPQEPYIPFNT